MNAVKIFPVYSYTVWYMPVQPSIFQRDASIVDGDGDLLLITDGWTLRIIHIAQVQGVAVELVQMSHSIEGMR